ncbi:MAG: hypothetical protein KF718_29390 [Polyangiaceae bacterium]|nr:hypothetical protein [Polyangiaceae bacterium]
MRGFGLLLPLLLLTVSCGTSSLVDSALSGDLATLKREVKAAQDKGTLDRSEALDLARAVAAREVHSARGQDAVSTLRSFRACAAPLSHVLEERAKRSDDVAAEATLILYELGVRSAPQLVERHHDAASGAWRAVAARAAVRPRDFAMRRGWFTDPDQRVRRAALDAAVDAPSRDDVDALFESARLDPDALSRSIATRALGALGGSHVANLLDDLWARADETTRVTLVDAWGMKASFEAGGREKLVRIAETESGLPPLAAAAALTRHDAEARDIGVAVLIRASSQGTETERRLALRLVPLDDVDARAAVEKATATEDAEVAVMAWARLAGTADARERAIEALRKLAPKDDDIGLQARAALAAVADASVKPRLVEQLSAKTARYRTIAATSLLGLGEFGLAATALADDDPFVRGRVACAMLARAGEKR